MQYDYHNIHFIIRVYRKVNSDQNFMYFLIIC